MMKTKNILLLVLLSIGLFTNAQSDKLKDLLKGLEPHMPDGGGGEIFLKKDQYPLYNIEGEKISFSSIVDKLNSGDLALDIYAKNKQIKLLVARPTSVVEKQKMKQMMGQQPGGDSSSDSLVGEPAPEFSITTINGKKYDNASLKDKVVVVNFWFTTCAPCINEMPELNKIVEKYKNNKDVVFLGFALNDEQTIKKFLKKHPFDYQIVAKSRKLSKKYGVSSYPTNIVIGKDGKVLVRFSGFGPHIPNAIETSIEKSL